MSEKAQAVTPFEASDAVVGPKALLVKIHAIMTDVGFIPQDSRNMGQGYNYLSDAGIKERVQKALIDHGVVVLPVTEPIHRERFTTSSDKPMYLVGVQTTYTLFDIDSGESLPGVSLGEGCDSLDKAIYKAATGASKYFWRELLQIPTGDDPEADIHSRETQQAVARNKLAKGTAAATKQADTLNIKQMIAGFGDLKAQLVIVLNKDAGEARYYEILKAHGAARANDPVFMKSPEKGRAAYKAMLQAVLDAKAQAATEPSTEDGADFVDGVNLGLKPTDFTTAELLEVSTWLAKQGINDYDGMLQAARLAKYEGTKADLLAEVRG